MSGESLTALGGFTTSEEKADTIITTFTKWDSSKQPAIEKWREVESYRYATDTSSLPSGSAFTHSTHMPVVSAIAQDLEAILMQVVMPHEDWFTFEPSDAEAARAVQRKTIVSYLKNRHALNGYTGAVDKLRSDLVSYGICFSQVSHVDRSVGDRQGYIGPVVNRISPYDIVFDPTAARFEDSPKIIREIVSLGELHRRGLKGEFDNDKVTELLTQRRHAARFPFWVGLASGAIATAAGLVFLSAKIWASYAPGSDKFPAPGKHQWPRRSPDHPPYRSGYPASGSSVYLRRAAARRRRTGRSRGQSHRRPIRGAFALIPGGHFQKHGPEVRQPHPPLRWLSE